MAQIKIREILNEGGFGTRPYKFMPCGTLPTNPLKIRLNQNSWNVAYLIDSLSFGGAERQLVELLKGIQPYQGIISPHLYLFQTTQRGYYQNVDSIGLPVSIIPRKGKYDITLLFRLISALKKNNTELIHSFSVMAGLPACVAGQLLSLPVVASTIRNAKDRDFKTAISIKLQAALADKFVSNSHAGFDNRFKREKKNFKVVYNGVDMQRFYPSRNKIEAARKHYNLGLFHRLVVMSASLSINKDHLTLIEAIPGVLKKMPDTGFIFLGDGSEKKNLKMQADCLGIGPNVVFAGYVDDVYSIFAQCSVAVLLSNSKRHREGIANALLEAMAMRLPVIATAEGGTMELVTNGVNGLLVPPFDSQSVTNALLFLLKNKALCINMGEAGHRTVKEKFGIHRYVNEYLAIYQYLLCKKKQQTKQWTH